MKKHITTILLLLSFGNLFAQINPGEDRLFREAEITEIRLTMTAADKTFLHDPENLHSNTYVTTEVVIQNSELDTAVTNIGVRIRGNTARNHNKKSYKIDFKEFGGEQFLKYKKVNLKPNVNDPSVIRELLSMRLFRQMDVPAPRVAPAVLYMNDEYMGVYLMIEQIDDEFVDKRFGKEVGWLYKCYYSATLENDSRINDDNLYESKMNEETDTRQELKHFVEVLNNASGANFKTEISQILKVDRFLRYLAVEAIIGHWDGYSYLCNNYYFYYDEDEGQFEFIAYDTDNTWGIDWVDRDWATRDLSHFYRHDHPRPLTSRILSVPEYRDRYYLYLWELFDTYFTQEALFPLFDQYKALLDSHVAIDTYFDDSFGFSHDDFLEAFGTEANQQAKYALRSYVEKRRETGIPDLPEIVTGLRDEVFSVFPNPGVNGTFYVTGMNHAQTDFRLINLSGVSIPFKIDQLGKGHFRLKVDQPGGVYLLQARNQIQRVILR